MLEDVREQLAGQAPAADGRLINDPKGFVENFARRKLASNPLGLVSDDVLGYYEANDLPFYAHLAEHYGYCDRYFPPGADVAEPHVFADPPALIEP